jgi:uncharacterized membrane protein YccF (DUF307 family)
MVDGKELKDYAATLREDEGKSQNFLWDKYSLIVKILYFPIGLMVAMVVILQIVLLFITIIGIPVAAVLAKSLSTLFNPVNKKCVPKAVASEIDRAHAQKYVSNM